MQVTIYIPDWKKDEYKKAQQKCKKEHTSISNEVVKLIEEINKKGVK